MEEIRFVVTPPCGKCKPLKEYRRRFCCIGCSKLREETETPHLRKRIIKSKKQRDKQICELRQKGLTLTQISKKMEMPRSTIQSILKVKYSKSEEADYQLRKKAS